MSIIFQSTDQINDALCPILQNITGLSNNQIIIQHATDGQPFQQIEQDVLYVETYIEQSIEEIFKNREDVYDSTSETINRTQQASRMLMVHLIVYGPNSDLYIARINEKIYFQSNKLALEGINLFLIPDRTEYQNKIFEKMGQRWWQRSDLKLRFYNTVQTEETINTIKDVVYQTQEDYE